MLFEVESFLQNIFSLWDIYTYIYCTWFIYLYIYIGYTMHSSQLYLSMVNNLVRISRETSREFPEFAIYFREHVVNIDWCLKRFELRRGYYHARVFKCLVLEWAHIYGHYMASGASVGVGVGAWVRAFYTFHGVYNHCVIRTANWSCWARSGIFQAASRRFTGWIENCIYEIVVVFQPFNMVRHSEQSIKFSRYIM